MTSVEEVLEKLRAKAQPDQLEGIARYGMTVEKRLGVKIPELRRLAKEVGRDHQLALALWKIGRLEGWKIGRLEGWKVGRLDGW